MSLRLTYLPCPSTSPSSISSSFFTVLLTCAIWFVKWMRKFVFALKRLVQIVHTNRIVLAWTLKEITNKQKTVELQNCTLKKLQWFPDCYELIWKDRIQRSIRIYTSDHHNDCLLTYHVSQALPGFDSLCCMLDMCRDFVLDIPTDASLGYNLTCSSYLKEPNYFIFFLKPY